MIHFLNRSKELGRIRNALARDEAQLMIISGRRRVGKSRLLQEIIDENTVYFLADQRENPLQRNELAQILDKHVSEFSDVNYPDWKSLFQNLNSRLSSRITLILDEFPYLVENDPSLPSVIQWIVDQIPKAQRKFNLVLCGSLRHVMEQLGSDHSSPLFGRSDEILNIMPMNVSEVQRALDVDAIQAVEEYAVWGGIPRYWELRNRNTSFEEAVRKELLEPDGVLHNEVSHLLSENLRGTVQAESVLSLIGTGVNRLSEIASRLEKPATQFSGLLQKLIMMGFIRRVLPYGESTRSTKRTYYRICDPLFRFYYQFIIPNRSALEQSLIDQVWKKVSKQQNTFTSEIWESLVREHINQIPLSKDVLWDAPSPWWGKQNRTELEVDVMTASTDKKLLLVGECKWSDATDKTPIWAHELKQKATQFEGRAKNILPILFVKHKESEEIDGVRIIGPDDLLSNLSID